MTARTGWRELLVERAERERGVLSLRLVDPAGETLASFTPGSHLVVSAGGQSNAYSLTGECLCPQAYELSILRLKDGRGGSRWLHDQLAPGDRLAVSPPRSAFAPVSSARHHVLIAGGIGVTPLLSHARAARQLGRSFELIYAHRPGHGVALQTLQRLCEPGQLRLVHDRHRLADLVRERLAAQPLGAVVYVCGPGPMMQAVQDIATGLGWPPERLHSEAFQSATLDAGEPFAVRLRGRDLLIPVGSGISLLEALESEGLAVPNMCRQGVCGECRVAVTDGLPLHRDLYLSEAERAAGDSMLCCVSRARGESLELAL